MIPRRQKSYLPRDPAAPAPLESTITRRVQLREVDVLGILWHGHYAALFEEASTEARRLLGMNYAAFAEAGLRAPIVQLHVDYHQPLHLDEQVRVTCRLGWTEAARMDIEYEVRRADGTLAATGYTVNMFTSGATGEPLLVAPPLLREGWNRWRARAEAGTR